METIHVKSRSGEIHEIYALSEVDSAALGQAHRIVGTRANEAGIRISEVDEEKLYYSFLGTLRFSGPEGLIQYAKTAKLAGRANEATKQIELA